MRAAGYAGFSFREIAADVGIKSASVHHHFPTKADLAAAAARRYADRFIERVGDPARPNALERFVGACRATLADGGAMCLGGALGATADALPPGPADEARRFFTLSTDWLTAAARSAGFKRKRAEREAERLLALLQGAMLTAQALGDPARFDRATEGLAFEPPTFKR